MVSPKLDTPTWLILIRLLKIRLFNKIIVNSFRGCGKSKVGHTNLANPDPTTKNLVSGF
nr:MAG TPA: AAA domain protein [Caudoviricetes sp.]